MHCFVGNYSGASLPKIIKFGSDFTKLHQFNIMRGNVQFLGHPVYESCNRTDVVVDDKQPAHHRLVRMNLVYSQCKALGFTDGEISCVSGLFFAAISKD